MFQGVLTYCQINHLYQIIPPHKPNLIAMAKKVALFKYLTELQQEGKTSTLAMDSKYK